MIHATRLLLFSIFIAAAASAGPADVPAQSSAQGAAELRPLGDALEEWAMRNGKQLMFDADLAAGKKTAGAAGASGMAALSKLLEGTGLVYRELNARTISIFPRDKAPVQSGRTEQGAGSVRVAGTAEPLPASAGEEESGEGFSASKGIPEILVNGSRVLNMDIRRSRDDAQPYVIFDRETLANSGAANLEDFFRQRLPMESTAISESQVNSFLGARSSINLRGLGSGQTLILVDGHRMAGALVNRGVYQPDINGLPLSGIERVEILPTSASGIYGGNATGGVVNIVLRHDYTGVETQLTYDNTFDSGAERRRVDLNGGFSLESGKTSVLFAGSYADGDTLAAQGRDFVTRNIQRIAGNSPGFFYGVSPPPVGRTPNIRSANGGNLVLDNGTQLNSPITFVPEGYAGPTGAQGDNGQALVANAGRYNLDLADSLDSGRRPLLNTPTVKSLQLTLRRDFTPRWSAFLQAGGSKTVNESPAVSMSGGFRLAAADPNNPFAQDIRVAAPLVGLDANSVVESSERRLVAGAIVKLAHGWTAEADVSLDRSRFESRRVGSSGPSQNAPAQADVNSGALIVLRDLNIAPPDFSQYLDSFSEILPTDSTMKDYTLRASGPVFTLPSGPVNLSMLLERREETFDPALSSTDGGTPSGNQTDQSQDVSSAYLEAVLPLIGANNRMPGVRELQLQVAGRWDDYNSSGTNYIVDPENPATPIQGGRNTFSHTDTTFALRYVPIDDLMFRASYSTGFLPPAINNLVPMTDEFPGFLFALFTDQPVADAVTVLSEGNPDLRPETSKTWSAGVVLTPRALQGLRVSADWYRIEKHDNIVAPDFLTVLDNEARFPGRIVRNSDGQIATIDASSINIARTTVEGYDLALDYAFPRTSFGAFQLFAMGTIARHYLTQTFPGDPEVEHVGIITSQSLALSSGAFPVKFKGNLGLLWNYGQWTAGWTMRYLDSYRIDGDAVFSGGGAARINAAQGNAEGRVDSQQYHDVFAAYRLDAAGGSSALLANTEWRLGVRNVFNKAPPLDVSNAASGYYSGFGDPRLASYYLSAGKRF